MEAVQRHKRTFTEMSHSATLSPSPHSFGDPAASNFLPPRRVQARESSELLDYYQDRRRTPHPYNPPYLTASQEMSEESQPQRPPRLERQASQTIIDLTEDNDQDHFQPVRAERRLGPQRPPQMRRSSAGLIDLTGDEEDIVIIHERRRTPPRPAPFRPVPRDVSPEGLFVGQIQNARFGGEMRNFFQTLENQMHNIRLPHMALVGRFVGHPPVAAQQAMPVNMDYEHGAFENRKPEHQAPPPPRENFTRSPAEEDTIICPSCEQELIHDKGTEELVIKKNRKTQTKKEREEHPFWVVRECGHVYCNSCYQLRAHANVKPGISFKSGTLITKIKSIHCAVEDCDADVRTKDKWVGVFL